MQNQEKSYDNADSFAMIFDEAWKKSDFQSLEGLTIDEKIKKIIDQNKDHPFIKSSPTEAFNVAKFRLRLLKLEK